MVSLMMTAAVHTQIQMERAQHFNPVWRPECITGSLFSVDVPTHWVNMADQPNLANQLLRADLDFDLHFGARIVPKSDTELKTFSELIDYTKNDVKLVFDKVQFGETKMTKEADYQVADTLIEGTLDGAKSTVRLQVFDYGDSWVELRVSARPSQYAQFQEILDRMAGSLKRLE